MRKSTAGYGVLALAVLGAAALLALVATGVAASPSPPPQLLDSDIFPPPPLPGDEIHFTGLSSLPALPQPSAPITLPSPAWRIGITADGLYRLSYNTLAAAGVPVAGTAPSAFHLLWRGQEVALQEVGTDDGTFDPGDALLFYAEKFRGSTQDEKYTDENVYWLAVDAESAGLRMGSRSVKLPQFLLYLPLVLKDCGCSVAWQPAVSKAQVSADLWYIATAHAEENLVYWSRWSTTPGTSSTWFWERVTAIGNPVTRTYPLALTALTSIPHTATLRLEVAGRSYNDDVDPDHHLRLIVNSTAVGEVAWDGKVGAVFTLPVSSEVLVSGGNQVQVVVLTDLSAAQDVYVDWVALAYRRTLVAEGDRLAWTTPLSATDEVEVSGFSSPAIYPYDITHPLTPVRLVGAEARFSGAAYDLVMHDTAPAGTAYLAVAETAVMNVSSLSVYYPPDDLISPTVGTDEIIVAPTEFIAAVQPLAAQRRSQGLRVRVVDVADVYALFNGGVFHPEAIRAFVAHAYANWPSPPPAYLLLVGDGNFNFKGYNPAGYGSFVPSLIPPYLEFADPWHGEVPVDSRYGDVDGDGMPEVAVGRIPAASVGEVETAVDRILDYEADPTPPWRDRLLFVADNVPDASGDFEGTLDQLRTLVSAGMNQSQVYLTNYCGPPVSPPQRCPSATLALTQTWSAGTAMVTYAGHGSVNRWAHERLLVTDDIPTFQSGHGLPFMLSLDCLDGYWMFPPSYPTLGAQTRSLAEVLLLTSERGAVAVFAPAGLGTLDVEERVAQAMYEAMFEDGTFQLGPLTQVGREAVAESYMARTYTLFGDPALQLPWQGISSPR